MSTFPTCKLCHQKFSLKGPAPFLLPCLHCVCETCVTSAAGGVISCSTCQRDVNLTETRLQKDVITEKEILHRTVKHHPELVLCTYEEDGNQAVCWCKECEDFLCEHCQMIHGRPKISRHHIVEDIGDLQPGSFDVDQNCTIHTRFVLDTWDEDCSILICAKCKLGDHAEHITVEFDKAVDNAKKEVAGFQEQVQFSQTQQGPNLATMDTDFQAFNDTCSSLTEKISLTFNSLKTLIDQREKELQIELQQHQEKIRRELNEKKNTLEACQKKCQTTSDYIRKILQYSTRHDIMSLRHVLQSKTGECISSAQAIVYESLPLPRFNTDGLEKIKFALAGLGTISFKHDAEVAKLTNDCGSQTDDWVSMKCEKLSQELLQLRPAHQQEIQSMRETISKVKEEETKGLYRLTKYSSDEAYLLNCISLEFSKTRYRTDMVHVNTHGELINEVQPHPTLSNERLKNYEGTSSTVPLPRKGSPQYWEVKAKLNIHKTMPYDAFFLEIGLSRKEDQDLSLWIGKNRKSYSLIVENCPTHKSICRYIRRHGEHLLCLPDTLENIPGISAILHFGVVYDSVRNRIAFLDVKNEKIMVKVNDAESSFDLWPMFGVYRSNLARVSMSLVVGSDIDMTENKKALLLECLS